MMVLASFCLEGCGVIELNEEHVLISTLRVGINSGFKMDIWSLHFTGLE